jgi:hypothetical protein
VAARSFSMLIASSRKSAALTVRLCASARWPSSCAFSASDRSSLAWLRSSFVGMRHHKPDSLLSVARISDIKGEILSGQPRERRTACRGIGCCRRFTLAPQMATVENAQRMSADAVAGGLVCQAALPRRPRSWLCLG